MKEQELNELLDKAIGTKGNLRIPAYWMRKVFSGLMEWCKALTPDVDVPTKVSQLANDADYATSSDVDNKLSNTYSSALNESKKYTDDTIAVAIGGALTSNY